MYKELHHSPILGGLRSKRTIGLQIIRHPTQKLSDGCIFAYLVCILFHPDRFVMNVSTSRKSITKFHVVTGLHDHLVPHFVGILCEWNEATLMTGNYRQELHYFVDLTVDYFRGSLRKLVNYYRAIFGADHLDSKVETRNGQGRGKASPPSLLNYSTSAQQSCANFTSASKWFSATALIKFPIMSLSLVDNFRTSSHLCSSRRICLAINERSTRITQNTEWSLTDSDFERYGYANRHERTARRGLDCR